MTDQEIIAVFEESKALLNGHFQLRSGLHSNQFFQAALLLQYPDKAELLCKHLATKFDGVEIETVISPAVGGLIVGQEMGRALGTRAIFADKDEGKLVLKRGFSIKPGEKVLVAEDVITRGGRVQECIDIVKATGANPVAATVLVDRSEGKAKFEIPCVSLLEFSFPTYEADKLPPELASIPASHPGS